MSTRSAATFDQPYGTEGSRPTGPTRLASVSGQAEASATSAYTAVELISTYAVDAGVAARVDQCGGPHHVDPVQVERRCSGAEPGEMDHGPGSLHRAGKGRLVEEVALHHLHVLPVPQPRGAARLDQHPSRTPRRSRLSTR